MVMPRICFDRIIPDRYQPARAEAHSAAVQHFRASAQAMVKKRKLKPEALGDLHADDPIVTARKALINAKRRTNGKTLQCRFLAREAVCQAKAKHRATIREQDAKIKHKFNEDGAPHDRT